LGLKAREFNRLVSEIIKGQPLINLVPFSPRVDICIADCFRIDWDAYDDLERTEGDARLIAEILNVKGIPKEQRIVVGHDVLPLSMARRYVLRTHHVSDCWLPRPELSPKEKEIEKLKRKVSDYEKTEPQFEVTIDVKSGPLEIHRVEKLSPDEMSLLTETIIAANPRPKQAEDLLVRFFDYGQTLKERHEEFESKYVPNFVSKYHEKIELLFGQIPITLKIENSGKVRAEHMHVHIQIVGGWFNKTPIVAALHPKLSDVEPAHSIHQLQPNFSTAVKREKVDRYEIKMTRPRRSAQFSAQCEDFRHGQTWELTGVVWLDPSQDREAVIVVKITAANFHGENASHFKLNKSIVRSKPFVLVDKNDGRALRDYHIKPFVDETYRTLQVGIVEWDKLDKNG
jgi:hypothetical protein